MSETYEKIPFWVVWNPESHSPTRKHKTQKEAEKEAARLARDHPGTKFYVLAPESVMQRSDIITTRFSEVIPF